MTDARCSLARPICIGGSGERRTLRTAARFAQHWTFGSGTIEQLSRAEDVLYQHRADIGRDPAEIAAAVQAAGAEVDLGNAGAHATDAIGRHGVAVAQTADGIRTELIFSKTSLKLIGERTVLAELGISTGATAIIRQAFADRLGQGPPAPKNPAP